MKSAAMFHEEHRMTTVRSSSTVDRAATLQRLRRLARVMDSAVTLPGTRVRFGLDPLIGLVPVLGDAVSVLVSLYTIQQARKLGVGNRVLAAMAVNVASDALLGAVPVLGDLFDFAFKANTRNLMLLEKYLAKGERRLPTVPPRSFAEFNQIIGAM